MRTSLRLLMASAMPSVKGMTPGPMALLPPIYLYRRLLRAHRNHLPSEMRLLGDEYVKAEFRAHRDVENPVHLVSQQVLSSISRFAQKWRVDCVLDCYRLDSSRNGSFTRRRLKGTRGPGRSWIRGRLQK